MGPREIGDDTVCIRWYIDRKLLERIDKNYYGYGSRHKFLEEVIKKSLDCLEGKK